MKLREYSEIHVESNRFFVKEGQIWTSAGVTAGIDLALALIKKTSVRKQQKRPPKSWSSTIEDPAANRSFRPGLNQIQHPGGCDAP